MYSIMPNGWKLMKIEDLYHIVGGGTPSTVIPDYWSGNIPWITSADIHGLEDIRPRKSISEEGIANSATTLVPANSLIVVTRVSLGKVALTNTPICFSQDSQALIAKDDQVLPKYALYYLSQAVQVFKFQSRGTTISGVTKKQLKDLEFPLPPLPEQERIVAKIEELFTQLEAGTAALRRIQAGLKRYKASLLKAACEGRLVPQDPSDEPASELLRRLGKKPLEDPDLPELPSGWCWIEVGELADQIQYGYTESASIDQIGPKFLRITDIQDGKVNWETVPYCKIDSKEKKKYLLQEGDILFARTGATTGKSYLIKDCPEAVFASYLIRLRITRPFDVNYFSMFLDSPLYWSQIMKVRKGSAQPGVNATILATLKVPLPPLLEQKRIVTEVERQISLTSDIDANVEANLSRSDRLRQAILQRAFEGRLVEQHLEEIHITGTK